MGRCAILLKDENSIIKVFLHLSIVWDQNIFNVVVLKTEHALVYNKDYADSIGFKPGNEGGHIFLLQNLRNVVSTIRAFCLKCGKVCHLAER